MSSSGLREKLFWTHIRNRSEINTGGLELSVLPQLNRGGKLRLPSQQDKPRAPEEKTSREHLKVDDVHVYTVTVIGTEASLQAELSEQLTEAGVLVLPLGAEIQGESAALDTVIWIVTVDETMPVFPEAPLLALAESTEDAVYALQHGALGVLALGAEIERLLTALSVLTQGLAVLEPAFLPTQIELDRGLEPLTPREREVLTHLAEGLPNKAIAKRLGISDQTVKFHLNALLGKLGATSRTEVVTKAVRAGLLTL